MATYIKNNIKSGADPESCGGGDVTLNKIEC